MDEQARIEPRPALHYAIVLAPSVEGFVLFFFFQSVNPIWSSLFGLGGHLVQHIVPPHGMGWIDIFGQLVWPAVLLAALHWLGGRLHRLRGWRHGFALGAWLLSLLVVVPIEAVDQGDWGLDRLPLYFVLWRY